MNITFQKDFIRDVNVTINCTSGILSDLHPHCTADQRKAAPSHTAYFRREDVAASFLGSEQQSFPLCGGVRLQFDV